MGLGRLQISCPSILGEGSSSWAMPCVPYAGPNVGFFALPPTGANIWVEFEGGDPDYPIWSGCFWGATEIPEEANAMLDTAVDHKVFKTKNVTILIDDEDDTGGVTVEIKSPAVENDIKLVCDTAGVLLTVGEEVSSTMTAEDITLAVGEDTSHLLSADGIELIGAAESTVTLTSSEIESVNGDGSVKIESSAVTVAVSSSEGKWESSAIELANGSGSVKVESSGVNINSGAVEVQ